MQQTLRVTLKRDPDVTVNVDVTYEDDEWMEGARQGMSEAAKMVAKAVEESAIQ